MIRCNVRVGSPENGNNDGSMVVVLLKLRNVGTDMVEVPPCLSETWDKNYARASMVGRDVSRRIITGREGAFSSYPTCKGGDLALQA